MSTQSAEIEVQNKQVILKHHVIDGNPSESDMEVKLSSIKLKAPSGSDSILLKNLYLSCDPYMRLRMRAVEGSYVDAFKPGEV